MSNGRDGDRHTREISVAENPPSDPPTTVTNLTDVRALLKGDVWTLTVLTGELIGMVRDLDVSPIVVGRGSDADVRQNDDSLSRRHAAFWLVDGTATVRDLGSTNGTLVNGTRLEMETPLVSGAHVQLGLKTTVRVQLQHALEVEAAKALYESSMRDQLTGVYNRRLLDERLVSELAFATRHRAPMSILMVDIDHFKKINDTYGHLGGDAVLQHFGALLLDCVRCEDVVGRYGGEEFTLILREQDVAGATILAERIRALIETSDVQWQEKTIPFTASIGVASHDTTSPRASVAALVEAADACLYRAKRAGRNLVVSDASPRSVPPRS